MGMNLAQTLKATLNPATTLFTVTSKTFTTDHDQRTFSRKLADCVSRRTDAVARAFCSHHSPSAAARGKKAATPVKNCL
jgi:glucose-6-phosphate isomerase